MVISSTEFIYYQMVVTVQTFRSFIKAKVSVRVLDLIVVLFWTYEIGTSESLCFQIVIQFVSKIKYAFSAKFLVSSVFDIVLNCE